jgi:hypothetical protein
MNAWYQYLPKKILVGGILIVEGEGCYFFVKQQGMFIIPWERAFSFYCSFNVLVVQVIV